MKWLAVAIAAVSLSAAAVFATYTFGWREDDGDGDRASAQAFASALVADCGDSCELADLKEVAPEVWRATIEGDETYCFNIHLDRFAPNLDEDFFDGVSGTECPADDG